MKYALIGNLSNANAAIHRKTKEMEIIDIGKFSDHNFLNYH